MDGLGGAFVTGIDGDHHNVVGVSLPLLRDLVLELGHSWTDLWHTYRRFGGEGATFVAEPATSPPNRATSCYSTGRPRPRAMSIRWTSEVPSPISRILASR